LIQKENGAMAEMTKYMVTGQPGAAGLDIASFDNPQGGPAGLTLAELAFAGKISLRGDGETARIAGQIAGCRLPNGPGKAEIASSRILACLGPDEWLLLCEAGAETGLLKQLDSQLAGTHSAAVNVSDALVAWQMGGAELRRILAKGCALDLHPRQFGPGCCAQTMLAHAGVTLICEAPDSLVLICRTSFAAYTAHWLADAAADCGLHWR